MGVDFHILIGKAIVYIHSIIVCQEVTGVSLIKFMQLFLTGRVICGCVRILKDWKKSTFRPSQFRVMTPTPHDYESLSNEVRALCEDMDQNLWVGLKDGNYEYMIRIV